MSNKKYIILDLDNCISDDKWRMDRIDKTEKDPQKKYDHYHDLCHLDRFGYKNGMLVRNAIDAGHFIVIITGRPERVRKPTEEWLQKFAVPFHFMFMRPNNAPLTATELKGSAVELMSSHLGILPGDIVAAYDDRQDVIDMYKEYGIPAERHFIHEVPQID